MKTQILKRPVMTEKSLSEAALGKFTFEVERKAGKPDIKKAIEEAFGVHVRSVHTINLPGKKRKSGRKRKEVIGSARKKAIVKLGKGEKIDLFTIPGQEAIKKEEEKK